jgi:lipopolysaccharide transport system permease protein
MQWRSPSMAGAARQGITINAKARRLGNHSTGFSLSMDRRYIELATYRALADFRSEVSRMYLGVLWWVLEPLLYVSIFYVVFGLGFRQQSEMYVPFLLCGLVVWKWLDSTVRTASGTIAQSVGIMSQVYLPKVVFPMITVLTNGLKFLIILAIYLVFLCLYGVEIKATWLWLLALVPLQLVFVATLAALCAGLVPLLPDVGHAINYGMTFLFFASGIFFDVSTMSPAAHHILSFNPALQLIELYRGVLLRGEAPPIASVAYLLGWIAVLALLSTLLYKKMDRVYPKLVG